MRCTSTTKTVQYVYDKFKKHDFEMDLTAIVEHGLNYVLLARYLRWRRDGSDLGEKEGPLDSRMGIQEFVEYMMQKQVGYLTPRSFLSYAVDYFTIQPLVSSSEESSVPLRIHELGPTCFLIAALVALETAVGDPYLTTSVRVASGKL